MRLIVAAGTLWLLFSASLMLHVVGERRLMRVADVLLALDFLALAAVVTLDDREPATVIALVVAPSLAGGFIVYCVQLALRGSRHAARR